MLEVAMGGEYLHYRNWQMLEDGDFSPQGKLLVR